MEGSTFASLGGWGLLGNAAPNRRHSHAHAHTQPPTASLLRLHPASRPCVYPPLTCCHPLRVSVHPPLVGQTIWEGDSPSSFPCFFFLTFLTRKIPPSLCACQLRLQCISGCPRPAAPHHPAPRHERHRHRLLGAQRQLLSAGGRRAVWPVRQVLRSRSDPYRQPVRVRSTYFLRLLSLYLLTVCLVPSMQQVEGECPQRCDPCYN